MQTHFKAQLTAQDYADAQRLHLGFRVHYIVGTMALAGIVLAFWLSGDPFSFQSWVFIGRLWLICLLTFFLIVSWGTVKRSAKIFAQQKDLQRTYDVGITDDHLIMGSTGRGEWKIPWDDFHKWKMSQKLVLVYPSDRLFRMFPRRWFASDDEFQGFKDLLTRTVGPAGKAKKRT